MATTTTPEVWNLENTPTWAVAAVCTIFVSVSFIFVLAIEKLEHFLKRKHRKPLVHALQKMKEELLLLGFISLLLTFFQNYVSSICVKTSVLDGWRPCNTLLQNKRNSTHLTVGKRRLLSTDSWPTIDWRGKPLFHGRILSQSTSKACHAGHSPLVSNETLAQMHTFIFVLAGVHVIYSLFAMLLASTRVNKWRVWEGEAHQESQDNQRKVVTSLSLNRQTTFIKSHSSKPWTRNRFVGWIICFFRQFGNSVVRADYLALRLGFVKNHNTGPTFDFHSYIIRSLEDDYQEVVGISPSLWLLVILFMLFNAFGATFFFWISLVPAVLVLVVGTKLEHVIATLALESAGLDQNSVYAGPVVKPRDELFWFKRPKLILYFIHYIIFQNAFQMATFVSIAWQFGLHSCLLRDKGYVYVRLAVGALVHILCSYITLPLYGLVAQMGSHYKKAIFQEEVQEKLRHWRKGAKKRLRQGASTRDSQDGSSLPLKDRSAESSSPDELELETLTESENEKATRFDVVEEIPDSPREKDFSTLQIDSLQSKHDGKPPIVPAHPPLTYTRAKSVAGVSTQAESKKFHKSSSDAGAGPRVHFPPDCTLRHTV